MDCVVEVVEYETGNVIHSVPCKSAAKAEKVEAGMDRNLDHDKYYTRCVSPEKDKE